MGFISSINSEIKVSAAFYSKTISVTNGVEQPESWTLSTTVDGLMWFGSQNLSLINDRLKSQVDGAIQVDYDPTIAGLDDSSKFIVDSINYMIVNVEDVGKQNEVLQILFKEDK